MLLSQLLPDRLSPDPGRRCATCGPFPPLPLPLSRPLWHRRPIGVSFSAYTGEVLTGGAPGSGVFDTDGSRRAMNRTLINTPQAASVKHLKPKLSVSDPALRGVRYTSSQL